MTDTIRTGVVVIDTLNKQAFGPFTSGEAAQAFRASMYGTEVGGDDGTLEIVVLDSPEEFFNPHRDDEESHVRGLENEFEADMAARYESQFSDPGTPPEVEDLGLAEYYSEVERESERRRQAIDHLLIWKTAALEVLSEGAFEAIQERAKEKERRDEAPLPMVPSEVMSGYGDLVSTIIWYPTFDHEDNAHEVICRNCQTPLQTHELTTGACQELYLRRAHGDK